MKIALVFIFFCLFNITIFAQVSSLQVCSTKSYISGQEINSSADYWYKHCIDISGEHFIIYDPKIKNNKIDLRLSYQLVSQNDQTVGKRTWVAYIDGRVINSDDPNYNPNFTWSDKYFQYTTINNTIMIFKLLN
jgi:hypothetical protein